MLELARDLLERAEHDELHLIPVVFPLSSWTGKQPLTEWMVEELINKYDVPRKLARAWVEAELILPLLDGLDEVVAENRTACIKTVNTYHQEHAFLPLVVASRSADYLKQTARVTLASAVSIQPLTQQQVDDYLARGGEPLWALRVALHQDTALRELTETPLMLSILALTYHDLPVEDLLRGGIAPTRQQVFEHYVERMLSRRGTAPSSPSQHTKGWLAWLARQMKQQNQTVFYLERLQPDWLPSGWAQRLYEWLSIRLPGVTIGVLVTFIVIAQFPFTDIVQFLHDGLFPGLVGGCIGGLLSKQHSSSRGTSQHLRGHSFFLRFITAILLGLFVGVVGYWLTPMTSEGFLYSISYGLGSLLFTLLVLREPRSPREDMVLLGKVTATRRYFWNDLLTREILRYGLLAGGLFGLSAGLGTGLSFGLSSGLRDGLGTGLSIGLSGILIGLLLIPRSPLIEATEILAWSWKSLWQSLINGRHRRNVLLIAFGTMMITGLSEGLASGLSHGLGPGLSVGLSFGLGFGLCSAGCYWPLVGLFQGISSDRFQEQQRTLPNLGIHRSLRNGLLLGVLSGGVSALVSGLSVQLNVGLSVGLSVGLLDGLNWGLDALSAGLV